MGSVTETLNLPEVDTTLFYYLEVKDGGIIQTYPGTAFEKRRKHVPHQMTVKDLRPIKEQFKIDECGFELVPHVSAEKTFDDEEHVKQVYYPEVIDLIKRVYVPFGS